MKLSIATVLLIGSLGITGCASDTNSTTQADEVARAPESRATTGVASPPGEITAADEVAHADSVSATPSAAVDVTGLEAVQFGSGLPIVSGTGAPPEPGSVYRLELDGKPTQTVVQFVDDDDLPVPAGCEYVTSSQWAESGRTDPGGSFKGQWMKAGARARTNLLRATQPQATSTVTTIESDASSTVTTTMSSTDGTLTNSRLVLLRYSLTSRALNVAAQIDA